MFDYPAFAALIRRKRGELSMETVAIDAFGKTNRKSDISKFEKGQKKPNERTIKRLCAALSISPAEMEPIRQSRPVSGQLDNIPTLSREELENLSARFGVEDPYGKSDDELRDLLTDKAQDYRLLRQQIAQLDDKVAQIAELKVKAKAAAEAGDLEQVDTLLAAADFTETAMNAATKITRAQNALLRNKPEQAFDILSATADSFRSVDATAPAKMRGQLNSMLLNHGLRYGGPGMALAEQMLRDAVPLLPKDCDPRLRIAFTTDIASAQQQQAIRLEGPAMAEKLGEAAATYQELLATLSKKDDAILWATVQNNFAVALQEQGILTVGAAGADLLTQAVAACENAMEVTTHADHPVEWAAMQNNLGNALQEQGTRTVGAAGADLLAQAVTAYKNALEVTTRAENPVKWADTQNNLGNALQRQGTRTEGAAGADLLAQAVTAYENTLEVTTRADHPVQWAETQNNLAVALRQQGTRTEGAAGADLLAQAVTAYENALEVRTRMDHPVQWAETQENMAIAKRDIAARSEGPEAKMHLQAALDHVENALQVYDPVHMSYDHGTATRLRDDLLERLSQTED